MPLLASAPLQPPPALQEVAFVELQVNVVASPLLIVDCDALIDAVGMGLIGVGSALWPQAASNSEILVAKTGVINRMASLFFNTMRLGTHALAKFMTAFYYVKVGTGTKSSPGTSL